MSRADITQFLLQAARQRSEDARKRTMQRVDALSDENQRLRRKVEELHDLVATLYGLCRSEQSGAHSRSYGPAFSGVAREPSVSQVLLRRARRWGEVLAEDEAV
jgi:hypothetical protein